MDFITTVIAKIASDVVASALKRRKKSEEAPPIDFEDQMEKAIAGHLVDLSNWSSKIPVYGLGVPHATQDTIPLSISGVSRSFRNDTNALLTETNIFESADNLVLLGDPGAGKTTTVKRLVQMLLTDSPVSKVDEYRFPIALRLRELEAARGIHRTLAQIIGVPYAERKEFVDGLSPKKFLLRAYVGDTPLESFLPRILDELRCILFFDGLDEISKDMSGCETQLEDLGRRLTQSKMIVTVRSGFSQRILDTFSRYEIVGLDQTQTIEIAKKWLPNWQEFVSTLNDLPYRDLADRPLILTQLIYLFSRKGYLPSRAALVCKKVVALLLEEWDTQRGITRASEYAGFDPEQKIEFLSELAFHLLYQTRAKTFSSEQLDDAYLAVHKRFRLPSDQAGMVVTELQTHSGLIVANDQDGFEFSHLSLQEYLAANYIVNIPQAAHLRPYVDKYPPPLAIAVSLSSKPSAWLAHLLLQPQAYEMFDSERIQQFLSRLITEAPNYDEGQLLGHVALKLLFDWQSDPVLEKTIERWITSSSAIVNAIGGALQLYSVERPMTANWTHFKLRQRCRAGSDNLDIPIFAEGIIRCDLFRKIIIQSKSQAIWSDVDERCYYLRVDGEGVAFEKSIQSPLL